ncbi:MAG: hypothetical protein MUO73_07400, partial [Thermoplasmata archaeon]|nr:hypothetical protein [Thermoplasmata archaeon]
RYNFYDTDTWSNVRKIDQLTHGAAPQYDTARDLPVIGIQVIGSLMVIENDTPLDIFNKVGFLSPILALLFAITVYILVTVLFSENAGFYSSIFIMFSGWNLFHNSLFGIIDHHLLSVFMCLTLILCILICVEYKSDLFLIPAVLAGMILYFTASMFWFYIVIVAFVIGILLFHYLWRTYVKYRLYLILIVSVITGLLYLQFKDTYWINLLVSWYEPITESVPISPVMFILISNVMILILIYGIYRTIQPKNYDIVPLSLLIVTVGLAILTFKFQRIEYVFSPFAAIVYGYYLDRYVSRINARMLLIIFLTFSIVLSGYMMGSIIDTSNDRGGVGDALLYLKGQEPGTVLAWWDYGFWIGAVSGQIPFTDPTQGIHAIEAAEIFTGTPSESKLLLHEYDIKYIMVFESDYGFYPAMQWYAKSIVPYEQSYLKELIDGTASNGNVIYNQSGIKVYRI